MGKTWCICRHHNWYLLHLFFRRCTNPKNVELALREREVNVNTIRRKQTYHNKWWLDCFGDWLSHSLLLGRQHSDQQSCPVSERRSKVHIPNINVSTWWQKWSYHIMGGQVMLATVAWWEAVFFSHMNISVLSLVLYILHVSFFSLSETARYDYNIVDWTAKHQNKWTCVLKSFV